MLALAGEVMLWNQYQKERTALIDAYKNIHIPETEARLTSLLSPSIFSEKNLAAQRTAFEQFWNKFQAEVPTAFHAKIWNTDSVVIWSNVESAIGGSYPDNHELQEALEGEIEAEFSLQGQKDEQISERRLNSFVEFYLPVRGTDNTIIGAFEVYYAASDLARTLSDIFMTSGIFMLGLAVLTGVLIWIVQKRVAQE